MPIDSVLEGLRRGDQAAWRDVMREHGPRLLGYATRMLGDRTAAEEVVQDSLVAAYKGIERFEGTASVKSWLFRIVHNRSVDELRRRKRYVDHEEADIDAGYFDASGHWALAPPDWRDVEERIDAKKFLEEVHAQIDKLPHTHREILLLKERHDLSNEEICEALDLNAGALRTRLHRARKALRAAVLESLGR